MYVFCARSHAFDPKGIQLSCWAPATDPCPACALLAASATVLHRLPSGQQLVYFFSFMGGGVLFLFMAFFIGLPTLLLSPSKFALFFTIGCCLIMSGFAALKGWRSQMAHMMQRERLPFSAGQWQVPCSCYASVLGGHEGVVGRGMQSDGRT